MGTVVFPDAPLKIFLTASAEERARRRYLQLKGKGEDVSLSSLLDEIRARDERDTQRAVAPLKPAADAIQLDSTELRSEEHTSELQSLMRISYAVFCLKNTNTQIDYHTLISYSMQNLL